MGQLEPMARFVVAIALCLLAAAFASAPGGTESVYQKYLHDQTKATGAIETVVGEQEKLVEELQKKHQFAEAKVSALKVSMDMLEKEHNHLVNESGVLTDLVTELQSMKRLLEEEKANFTRLVDEEKTRIEMVRDEMKEQLDKKATAEKLAAACNKSKGELMTLVKQREPMEPKTNEMTKELTDLHNEAHTLQSQIDPLKKYLKMDKETCVKHCNSSACVPIPSECADACPKKMEGELRVCGIERKHSIAGRLEVYKGGKWGSVCDEEFNHVAAGVACRQLGFSNGHMMGNCVLNNPSSTDNVFMSKVKCTGGEKTIQDCDHVKGAACSHAQDVSVSCFNLQ